MNLLTAYISGLLITTGGAIPLGLVNLRDLLRESAGAVHICTIR